MADESNEDNRNMISCCKCSLEYVSVACNRTPLCVDWGRNGWLAYGACYSIALYRPKVELLHIIITHRNFYFPRASTGLVIYTSVNNCFI